MKTLLEFVQGLPVGWATAPIYAKGQEVEVPHTDKTTGEITVKIEKACGKRPVASASKRRMSPSESARLIEQSPERLAAIGFYTGTRSENVVCLDIDANLSIHRKKWEDDLQGFHVLSPKKNAGKWLFTVPEELCNSVRGISLKKTGQGFEILWGVNAVLCGAYPAGGEYVPHGDPNDLPEAPGWLLEIMKEQYRQATESKRQEPLSDRWSTRSREEKVAIVEQCLSVILPAGSGSEEFWWDVGAMVHATLPGDEGLELWRDWSQRDPEYQGEWESGRDCCEEKWRTYRVGGRNGSKPKGLGSLIMLADEYDPKQERFRGNGLEAVVAEVGQAPQKWQQAWLPGEEVLKRAKELEETIENPALLSHEKQLLALQSGRRSAADIDLMLDQDLTYTRSNAGAPTDVANLSSEGFEYLIPGLLPKPWVLLVHADGGTGKSAMAMTLCKHITQGLAFNVHGQMFDVPRGRALWLNGDQSERITRRQFNLMGVETGVDVVGEWDMQWYRRFCRMQTKGKYDLIVIDSLDGCNDSNPYEENRREYARPIKMLAKRNGIDFPACSVVIVHHNNRTGGFRGTSAIRAAVDETWNMKKLDGAEYAKLAIPFNSRLITVEKSRDDREGQEMVFTLLPDFTYLIGALPEQDNAVKNGGPNEYMLEVLKLLAENPKPWCAIDIEADEKLGGDHRKRAIRYALKRLEEQALVERCAPPSDRKFGRKPPVFYLALSNTAKKPFSQRSRARGVPQNTVSTDHFSSAGTIPVDNEVCQQTPFVNSSDAPAENEKAVDKADLLTNAFVNRNPSTGTEDAIDTRSAAHRVEFDNSFAKWDQSSELVSMSSTETLEAISDYHGCIDIDAKEVQ